MRYVGMDREGSRQVGRSPSGLNLGLVEGFCPKLLAKRTVIGTRGTGHMRLTFFWVMTIFGMTFPYRLWFSRNCEAADLMIVKSI